MTNNINQNLDVSLRNGLLVNEWLSGWVAMATEKPDEVKLVCTARDENIMIIEFQDKNGMACGGILYLEPRGSVYVLGTLKEGSENETKSRSLEEMRCALELALNEKEFKEKAISFYKARYGIFAILAINLILIYLLFS